MNKKVFLLCAALASNSALADTRYVTDNLLLPLRSGQGEQYSSVDNLRSGTKVEELEVDKTSGFSRVRTADGKEGWIRSRHLLAEPTARLKLEALGNTQGKISSDGTAAVQITELEAQVKTLGDENTRLNQELNELKQVAANAINLDASSQELVKTNELLKNDLDLARAEVERLQQGTNNNEYYRGAFAVLLGVAIAVIVPLLKPRRRRNEWA